MNAKTPILFLIFNRPETTKKVFEAIRKYKPSKLFVAADGPRTDKPGEKERCEKTRKIIEKIDWPCEVERLYRNTNLGCKYAVSGAITWFFRNVEEGIILEDDCLPDSSFFKFCEHMLDAYRDNDEVMCISGDNFLPRSMQNANGYYFSKYVHIWGWATWRRAWKNYDVEMRGWPKDKKNGLLYAYFDGFLEKTYWLTLFDAVYQGKINTWDYQFVYHVWRNNSVAIMPNINLVSNIGFARDALHTSSVNSPLSSLNTGKIQVDSIKLKIKRNVSADKFSMKNVFNINLMNVIKQNLYYLLLKR